MTRRPAAPQPPAPFKLTRGHFAALAAIYGLAILYCSLMLGPDGLHYVPLSSAEAWQRFRAIHFVDNASDQRADWIANAIMTIPLACFVNGAVGLGARSRSEIRRAAIALVACIGFILAAKYAQLFFPPRTVTLNYIAAQSIGALLGIGLYRFAHRRLYPALRDMYRDGDGLVVVLGIYSLLLAAYALMPFDIALSPGDLGTRFAELPLSIAPGSGHSVAYRAGLVLADAVATVPVGMFLAVTERELSFRALLLRGIAIVVPITVLTLFVLSATPFALSLISRPVGVALGIWFIFWLKGKDLWKRHYRYAGYVPIAIPVYVILLLWGNGLLTGRWFTVDQAVGALNPRRVVPLWSLYVATKAEAAHAVVATLIIFAPIGGMIWLRRGFWSRGAGFSAVLAFGLSLAIEIGRSMKPGLTPEFTDPFIAAAGAAVTFRVMPALWKLFEQEAKTSILRDTYATKVARVAQVFGIVELLPRLRHPHKEAALNSSAQPPDYADQLSVALRRIAELEGMNREQERELDFFRHTDGKSGRSAG
jgi:VanZ family protein